MPKWVFLHAYDRYDAHVHPHMKESVGMKLRQLADVSSANLYMSNVSFQHTHRSHTMPTTSDP